jgi:periplasmic protein TonB
MPPRRFITFLSALVHAAILSTIFVTQLLSLGPLPVPRTVLAFSDALPVHIYDIPLPPPPRGTSAPPSGPANVAPIEAPPDIAPERDMPTAPSDHEVTGVRGVETGVLGGLDLPGNGLAVEPPPPPPPVSREPIRLHAGMQAPRKIVNVPPRYPALAQLAHIEGVVVLDAVIDQTGRVTDVHVTRSIQALDQAAIDAVRQWRFTPTLLNREPVSILLTVTVRFTLGPS